MKCLMTYNFYWSVIQAIVAYYAVRTMGRLEWLREQYSLEDVEGLEGIALVAALALATVGIIFAFQYVSALASGSPEEYFGTWREVVGELPLWSKAYLVAVAPLTAGIFEEVFWRGYGLAKLEEYVGTKRALAVQALAFGVWHGISLHAVATALVGLLYGYVYAKRRRLLAISAAHVVADVIGFSLAVLA